MKTQFIYYIYVCLWHSWWQYYYIAHNNTYWDIAHHYVAPITHCDITQDLIHDITHCNIIHNITPDGFTHILWTEWILCRHLCDWWANSLVFRKSQFNARWYKANCLSWCDGEGHWNSGSKRRNTMVSGLHSKLHKQFGFTCTTGRLHLSNMNNTCKRTRAWCAHLLSTQ